MSIFYTLFFLSNFAIHTLYKEMNEFEYESDEMYVDTFNREFWKVRYTKGDPRQIFKDAETFANACYGYFDWCSNNPFKEQNWVGKEGMEVQKNKPRVFTVWGLARYLHVSEATLMAFVRNQEARAARPNATEQDKIAARAFIEAWEHISDCIKDQKYSGAMSGFFHAGMAIRDLKLTDSVDVKHSGDADNPVKIESEIDVKNMSNEELRKAILAADKGE